MEGNFILAPITIQIQILAPVQICAGTNCWTNLVTHVWFDMAIPFNCHLGEHFLMENS